MRAAPVRRAYGLVAIGLALGSAFGLAGGCASPSTTVDALAPPAPPAPPGTAAPTSEAGPTTSLPVGAERFEAEGIRIHAPSPAGFAAEGVATAEFPTGRVVHVSYRSLDGDPAKHVDIAVRRDLNDASLQPLRDQGSIHVVDNRGGRPVYEQTADALGDVGVAWTTDAGPMVWVTGRNVPVEVLRRMAMVVVIEEV